MLQMRRTVQAQLPLNTQLKAANVFEFDVPIAVVMRCRDLYEAHMRPSLRVRADEMDPELAKGNRRRKWQSEQHHFFVRIPGGTGADSCSARRFNLPIQRCENIASTGCIRRIWPHGEYSNSCLTSCRSIEASAASVHQLAAGG